MWKCLLGAALVVVLRGATAAGDEGDCVPLPSGKGLEAWGWRLRDCEGTRSGSRHVDLGRPGDGGFEVVQELALLGEGASTGTPDVFAVVKAERRRVEGQRALLVETVLTSQGKNGDCAGAVLREEHTAWTCVEAGDGGVGCVSQRARDQVTATCTVSEREPGATCLRAGLPVGSSWVESLRTVGEAGVTVTRTRKVVVALDGGPGRAVEVTPLELRVAVDDVGASVSMASAVLALGGEGGVGADLRGDPLLDMELGQGAGKADRILTALLPEAAGAVVTPLGPRRHALGPAHAFAVRGGRVDGSASMGGATESRATEVRGEVVILDGTGVAVAVHVSGRTDSEFGRGTRGLCEATCQDRADWQRCEVACLRGAGPVIPSVVERRTTPLKVELTVECGR